MNIPNLLINGDIQRNNMVKQRLQILIFSVQAYNYMLILICFSRLDT